MASKIEKDRVLKVFCIVARASFRILRVLLVVASRNDPVSALYLGRFAYSQLSTRVWPQKGATKLR